MSSRPTARDRSRPYLYFLGNEIQVNRKRGVWVVVSPRSEGTLSYDAISNENFICNAISNENFIRNEISLQEISFAMKLQMKSVGLVWVPIQPCGGLNSFSISFLGHNLRRLPGNIGHTQCK